MSRYAIPPLLPELPTQRGVIQASAGTGKTYLLERMVVDFLLKGISLEKILVVTYTEKAALELRTRIRQMVETLVTLDDNNGDGDPVPDPAWEIGEAEKALLNQALRNFDRASHSTIHGFCQKVLMDGAFEGGTLLKQELTDGKAMFERAFRELLRVKFKDHPGAASLFAEVIKSGWTVDQLHKTLATAHSDKAKLLPEPTSMEPVLACFDPAWLEDPAALEAAFTAAKVNASRKKAAMGRLGALAELMQKQPTPFGFLEAWDFKSLKEACLALPYGPGEDLGLWLKATQGGEMPEENLLAETLLPPIQAKIVELKALEGLYDFDDIVLQTRYALESATGKPLIDRVREKFSIAIIDEFQDTDQNQWEIFNLLFNPDRAFRVADRRQADGVERCGTGCSETQTGQCRDSEYRNASPTENETPVQNRASEPAEAGLRLFVIGDPKQAIYGFRGGDLPTYFKAVKAILGDGKPKELQHNFRSTPHVIEAYNDIFTGGDTPEERFFRDPEIYPVSGAVQCGNPHLRASTDAGIPLPPVKILRIKAVGGGAFLRRKVADCLAQEIKETVEKGLIFEDTKTGKSSRFHFGDVKVLVGNAGEGRLMAKALGIKGVPCVAFKQKGLLQSQEALDLRDVLRSVEDPSDRGRRARAMLTPFFGYRLSDLEGVAQMAEDHPVLQKLQKWQQLGRQRQFPQMLEAMFQDSGLILRLRLNSGNERALTNYLHLAELLTSTGTHGAADLEALVRLLNRWIEELEKPASKEPELQRLEGQDEAVQIMTLHASKGLEGGIVTVFAHSEGMKNQLHRFYLNGQRCATFGKGKDVYASEIEEEANGEEERLMYVALTRAKAHLILPCFLDEDKDGLPKHPGSDYRVVNRRLRAIALDDTYRPDLYCRKDVEFPSTSNQKALSVDLSRWTMPPMPKPPAIDYEAARQKARPSFNTSYSGIDRLISHSITRPDAPAVDLEPDAPDAPVSTDNLLPRGTQTGNVIHELLEVEDCAQALGQDFQTWCQEPARRRRIKAVLIEHGLAATWEEQAAEMVHAALRVPLPNRNGDAAPLGVHDHLLREMGFLARFLDTGDFLNGSMDAVFQRGEQVYFLDWKTNTLPSYAPALLEAFVQDHYTVQCRIYTKVLLDYLGIHNEASYETRFGGIHYVFLRDSPPAIHTFRPTWAEVMSWEPYFRELHRLVAHV